MSERKGRIVWALTVIAVACAIQSQPDGGVTAEPAPRLSLNHTLHAQNGLECADCHDPEQKGEPSAPAATFCFECHEDIEGAEDTVKEYFAAARRGEGPDEGDETTWVWPGAREADGDLIFSHASHTGSYETKCVDCHGETTDKAFARLAPLSMKAKCIDCHQERGKDAVQCAVCHVHTRQDSKPASHDAAFKNAHGAFVPPAWHKGGNASWRDPRGGSCALCQKVPDSCNTCHEGVKPDSHREAGFRIAHGKGYLDAGLLPFEDSSCALCHTENSCVRCHQTNKPRNHTLSWQRRFHGIQAEVDRTTCLVCHKQDFCVRCHKTAKPVSHRGTFGRVTYSHCIACHEPLVANGCSTCHKNTRGHLSAPPMPGGAPHAGARDCRTCHRTLKHFDDGLSCRRCHR